MKSRETGQPKAALDEITNDSGNLAKGEKEEMFLFTCRKPETKLKLAVLNRTPQYSSSFSLAILNEITTYPILRAAFPHRFVRGTK